jgi:hypothetical protein
VWLTERCMGDVGVLVLRACICTWVRYCCGGAGSFVQVHILQPPVALSAAVACIYIVITCCYWVYAEGLGERTSLFCVVAVASSCHVVGDITWPHTTHQHHIAASMLLSKRQTRPDSLAVSNQQQGTYKPPVAKAVPMPVHQAQTTRCAAVVRHCCITVQHRN